MWFKKILLRGRSDKDLFNIINESEADVVVIGRGTIVTRNESIRDSEDFKLYAAKAKAIVRSEKCA